MKVYLTLFKLKFINMIQYRASAYAGILAQIFFGLVFVNVYLVFYSSNPNAEVPMDIQELISYLWLNQAFFAMTYIWLSDSNLIKMIKEGNIAYELCRPINFYKKWFATMYGNRIATVILRAPLTFVFAFLLPKPYNLGLPVSVEAFILFLIAIIISSLLVTSLTMIFHLITFFTLDDRGPLAFLQITAELFAGSIVPLAFLPSFLKFIANLLPFRFMVDLPFRIYTGGISIMAGIYNILIGIVWLIIMIIFGYLLADKATRKAVIQGG